MQIAPDDTAMRAKTNHSTMDDKTLSFGQFLQEFRDQDRNPDQPRFCFVIGSGCAATAGIPTGAQLVDRWLGELHDLEQASDKRLRSTQEWGQDPLPSLPEEKIEKLKKWVDGWPLKPSTLTWDNRAQFYSYIFEKRFRRADTGRAWLRKLILARPVSIGYHLLGRILISSSHRVVITTNFDRLVEDAIAIAEGIAVLPFGSKELARYLMQAQTTPVVAKIHGDVQLDTYNASGDIEKLDAEWQQALSSLLSNHTPIIVGYGGNDPGFMNFLVQNCAPVLKNRPIYWTSRSPERDAKHPKIIELLRYPEFRFVRIPGFEELMVALSECFALTPFEDLIQRRKEKILADYRSAHQRAKLAMEGCFVPLPAPNDISLTPSTDTEGRRPLPPPAKRIWTDWMTAIENADLDQQNIVISKALEEFPGNYALQARASAFRHARNPADLEQLNLVRKAAEESEQKYGWPNPETEEANQQLAYALEEAGRYDEAEKVFKKVLKVRKEAYGPDERTTLSTQNGLGSILLKKQKHFAAKSIFKELLQKTKRKFGDEGPPTLAVMNNLAIALKRTGNKTGALELHQKVLEIRRRKLGEKHPDTLASLGNVAMALTDANETAKSLQMHRKCVRLSKEIYGDVHPRSLAILNNYTIGLIKAGKTEMAERLRRKIYEERKKILGENHPLTLASYDRLQKLLTAKAPLKASRKTSRKIKQTKKAKLLHG